MDHLPVNKNVKFAKLLSTNTRFANFSLLAAIAVGTAGLVIVSGLALNLFQNPLNSSNLLQNPLITPPKVFADSASTPASSLAFAAYDRALASIQAQLTSVSSPTKLGKSGILTITDSGIIKPTDHNQTQGGIGTDVSRIGKIWGTFMDLKDDVSFNGKLDLSGKLTANGNVTLGNNDGDEIEVGGRFTSNLVPKKTNDIDLGTSALRWRTGYFINSIVVGSGTTTITGTSIATDQIISNSSSQIKLVSTGTLQLDTSTNNTNILLLTGTGNVGIGSTAPSAKLDVVGDMALNGDLDFTGPQNITTTSDNLTISPTGNLIIDTSGGTLSIRDAAIDLTNQPTTISGSTLTLRSTGTFILDTSASNTNLRLQAGSGNVQVSSNQLYLTGNLVVTGTETFNGVAYTFPGADGSASNVLTTGGTGLLSWGTLGGSSITNDSLDFAQFDDSLDLDADTSINGPYSFIVRAGQGSIENSTSGNNDLQLAAADKLILTGASFDLSTSNGAVDIISSQRLDLSAGGTLTLDTSRNNSHIVLTPGTGNIGIGSTAPVYKLDVNGTLRTSSTARVEGALTVTTGGASVTGDLSLDGDLDFTGAQNITTTADNLTLSPTGNLIIDTSGGTVSIRDAAIDLTNQPTTISGSAMTLRSTGTFIIDTSVNNTDIRLQAGSGNINLSSGATTISGNLNLNSGTLALNGISYTFPGADTANGVLISNGSGLLSWNTIGAANITADSLDFTEFKDEMTLDADTSINGPYSFIVRAGNAARQNATSGSNDLQLAAEDQLLLDAARFRLSTSSGSAGELQLISTGSLILDTSSNNTNLLLQGGTGGLTGNYGTISLTAITDQVGALALNSSRGGITLSSSMAGSNGNIYLKSAGTLQLDTSAKNSNIQLQAGSGNINLSSTGTITLTGNTSLNNGTLRLNGLTYTFPGTDTANGVLLTDGSGILSWTTGLTGASLADDTLDFVDFQDELDFDADTSINGDYSLIVRAGLGSIQNSTSGSNDLQLSAEDKLILGAASFDLLTSSGAIDIISGSYLDLSSKGTLTLDTSANNTNIVMTPGTGNIGIGSTAPVYKLDVNGTLRTSSTARVEGALTVTTGGASVTGDLSLDGDLDFTGAQNITTTADNLTLSPTGNLIIDTSGGTVYVRDAAIDLTNQPTTISGSAMTLRSTGTFIIDTSVNNTDIRLQAGSGNINLSSTGTITLTGNTSLNNGTLRLNGLTYTFPGTDTANGVLLTDGSGILSWTTGLTGASLADDTLDFVDLQDELDLDADTSVNGDYSLILRAGLGSIQNSTSGSNDLQLSAEDKLILGAASFDLLTSSGAVDILSGSYLDLSSKGTLTLDTSQNNSNIVLRAGSGNINLSSGTTTISGNVNLNSGTLTLNGVAYTFPGSDGSASQALTTNSAGILSWSTIGVSADSLDFTDLKDTLTMDSDTAVNGDYSFILRAGLGAAQDLTSGSNDIMAAAEDQMFLRSGGFNLTTSSAANSSIILRSASGGIQLSTGSASLGEMRLLSSGSLVLDTSLNNSNIRLQAGSGRIDLSGGTILVNSGTGTLTLSSESGVTVGGSLAATGNINSVDGGLQTNSVTRVSNSGAVSASALTMDTSPGKFTFQNGFYLQNISPTSLGMYDTGLNLVVTFDEE